MKIVKVTAHEDREYQYDIAVPDEFYDSLLKGDGVEDLEKFLYDCAEVIDDPNVDKKEISRIARVDDIFDRKGNWLYCRS